MRNLSACTLPTAERPTRLGEFDRFFTDFVGATARPAPTRLELRLEGGDAEPVGRDLAARESACCSFFTFTFTPDPTGTVMAIEVPDRHVDVLDTLARRAETAVRARG
ncbi:hypothetical protein IT779_30575 [Nocardia sp. NEAU-351]|uniref:Arsenate reductase n=2 Tax=Nocardia bovistercoris TaxID=2785916 RepID=A0A931N7D0_9NOCA|nr:hypothetical protein [Nocardia bovistercoris]